MADSIKDRVAAYRREHPKATDNWVCAALKITKRQLLEADNGVIKRGPQAAAVRKPDDPEVVKQRTLIRALLWERGELLTRDIATAVGLDVLATTNHLSYLQARGLIASRDTWAEIGGQPFPLPRRRRMWRAVEWWSGKPTSALPVRLVRRELPARAQQEKRA